MSTMGPRHARITPDDHGPYVVLSALMPLSVTVLTVMARLGTRSRTAGSDDLIVTMATAIAIIQTIAVARGVAHGRGQRMANLSETRIEAVYKACSLARSIYVGQLLEMATLFLSKASLYLLIRRLTPDKRTSIMCLSGLGVVSVWWIVSLFALAFQCDLPRPWTYAPDRCIDVVSLFTAISVVNILTDLSIILIPVNFIWTVQVDTAKKWKIIFVFACRILVCIATALQLVSFRKYIRSSDRIWGSVDYGVHSQFVINLSIICACIPGLHVVLASFQSGLLSSEMNRPFKKTSPGNSYGLQSISGNRGKQETKRVSNLDVGLGPFGHGHGAVIKTGHEEDITIAQGSPHLGAISRRVDIEVEWNRQSSSTEQKLQGV